MFVIFVCLECIISLKILCNRKQTKNLVALESVLRLVLFPLGKVLY